MLQVVVNRKAVEGSKVVVHNEDKIVLTDANTGQSPIKMMSKKVGKDLLIFEEGSDTPLAVYENYEAVASGIDISSLPHFADATAVISAVVASDATAGAVAVGEGLSTAAMVGLGVLGVVAVAAAASGGDTLTDTGSIEFETLMVKTDNSYTDKYGVYHSHSAAYVSFGILSGGKDINLSTITSTPTNFGGLDGTKDTSVNEIKITLDDVILKGSKVAGVDSYIGSNNFFGVDGEPMTIDEARGWGMDTFDWLANDTSFFVVRGGSEDIVDVDLQNWTDVGSKIIINNATDSLNGNYHIYIANGAEFMILEGVQVI